MNKTGQHFHLQKTCSTLVYMLYSTVHPRSINLNKIIHLTYILVINIYAIKLQVIECVLPSYRVCEEIFSGFDWLIGYVNEY